MHDGRSVKIFRYESIFKVSSNLSLKVHSGNAIAVVANGIYACVLLCFKIFSVLIFSMININRYDPEKQKSLGCAIILKSIKGS